MEKDKAEWNPSSNIPLRVPGRCYQNAILMKFQKHALLILSHVRDFSKEASNNTDENHAHESMRDLDLLVWI